MQLPVMFSNMKYHFLIFASTTLAWCQDCIYKSDDYKIQSCKHIYTSWNSSTFWVHQQLWHGMMDRERLGWGKQTITTCCQDHLTSVRQIESCKHIYTWLVT